MKRYILPPVLLLTAISGWSQNNRRLWYRQPAQNWNEALPIGNGHAGAMIFGGIEREQLQLNENTLYSGEPSTEYQSVKISPTALDTVIRLLRNKQYEQATGFVRNNWLGRLHQNYQPFGDLFITDHSPGQVTEYQRELNISGNLRLPSRQPDRGPADGQQTEVAEHHASVFFRPSNRQMQASQRNVDPRRESAGLCRTADV